MKINWIGYIYPGKVFIQRNGRCFKAPLILAESMMIVASQTNFRPFLTYESEQRTENFKKMKPVRYYIIAVFNWSLIMRDSKYLYIKIESSS